MMAPVKWECAVRRGCDSEYKWEFKLVLLSRMDHPMTSRLASALGAFAILSCTAPPPAPSGPMAPARFDAATVAKGARLAAMGNCVSCHTAQGGKPFAGGCVPYTPVGTLHAADISP